MQVVLHFGEKAAKQTEFGLSFYNYVQTNSARIHLDTDKMSEGLRAEYLVEEEKAVRAVARRTGIAKELEPKMLYMSKYEVTLVEALLKEPCNLSNLAKNQIRFLKRTRDEKTLEYVAELVDINLQEAQARREMASIAREHFYDTRLSVAKTGKADLQSKKRELELRSAFDKKAEDELDRMRAAYDADPVKSTLAELKRFDKVFLSDFNGFMLSTIHGLKECQMKLAARALAAPQKAAKTAPIQAAAPANA